MRNSVVSFVGCLLCASAARAQNTTSSNTTSSTEGLLSSGNVDFGDWTDAYAKATALVAQMTNDGKISLITGSSVSSVNWTALEFKDGTQSVQGTYLHSLKSCQQLMLSQAMTMLPDSANHPRSL